MGTVRIPQILLYFNYRQFSRGKGFYRAPAYLNNDKKYLLEMKTAVHNTILDHLELEEDRIRAKDLTIDETLDLNSTASPSTLFEVILSSCRPGPQAYVAKKNKERRKRDLEVDANLKKAGEAATNNPENA